MSINEPRWYLDLLSRHDSDYHYEPSWATGYGVSFIDYGKYEPPPATVVGHVVDYSQYHLHSASGMSHETLCQLVAELQQEVAALRARLEAMEGEI